MPMHLGHQNLIQQVVDLGYLPVLFLGEAPELSERNPWDFHTRHVAIKRVYPDIPMYCLHDSPDSWDDWFDNFVEAYSLVHQIYGKPCIALHDKPEDRTDFTFDGLDYRQENYSILFHIARYDTVQLEPSNIDVRATSIRSDLTAHKEFLDLKIYDYYKDKL
jgi:hypothetical protein